MQYGFLAVVGRLLGAAPAAPFYTMLSAATVLSALGRAGLDHFGLREIAASIANGRQGIVRALSARLLAVQLLWSAGLVAIMWLVRDRLAAMLVLDGPGAVAQLGALALGFVLTFSLAAYALAFRGVLESALVKTMVPYGAGGVLLIALYLYSDSAVQATQAVGALLTGLAIAVAIGVSFIVRKTAGTRRFAATAMPAVSLSRSLALAAIPLLMPGMTALDVVLLQAARPGAETSFYQAAQRTSM
ncbi:MAG: hypothetical protein PVJ51_13065, partial [Acidobacteriota bacterium]